MGGGGGRWVAWWKGGRQVGGVGRSSQKKTIGKDGETKNKSERKKNY